MPPARLTDLNAARHLNRTFKQFTTHKTGRDDTARLATTLAHEIDCLKKHRCEVGSRTVNTAVNLLCRWDMPGSGVRLMKEEQVPPDHMTHSILIKSYAKMKDEKMVRKLMQDRIDSGLPPDITCHNALLMSLRPPCEDEMRAVLEEIKENGIQPNAVTAREALNHCRTLDTAKQLYTLNFKNLVTEEEFLRSALILCSRNGDSKAAEGILERMEGPPTLIRYNMLLNSYAVNGDVEECLCVLKKMKARLLERPSAVSYTTAIKACSIRVDNVEGSDIEATAIAETLFEEALNSRIVKNQHLYTKLMEVYGKTSGEPGKARKIELVTNLLIKSRLPISKPFTDWKRKALRRLEE
eukprot:TRINITY_DN12069_c0_g1_i1.p1 TRINITY_DN12069_c0_g1~~TRINITY_DN12069_c0_g1_i1.p1  ORF type:complete len:354 (+),score=53.67 TRINITY_DN12069_c0_g1_i1:580-1641(+)